MIVVFDLETTGLDVDNDRIVQFAAVKLEHDGEEIDSLKLLIKPGVPISPEASAINRLTDEMVADAPRFAEVADKVLDFLKTSDLCGHNMLAFDLPLLIAELKRCGRYLPLEDRRLFDTKEIFRVTVPHTLAGALQHYCGQDIGDDAHDALVDARACADVLRKQVQSHDVVELEQISLGDRVTLDGKIVRDDEGRSCISFGKYAGTPLADVPKGYLSWMLKQDFPEETKAVVRRYV